MNTTFVYNLIFYLSPYVAMILYDLSPRTSTQTKKTFSIILSIILGMVSLFSLSQLFILGYHNNGVWAEIYGCLPPYLAVFYCVSVIVCVYALYSRGHIYYHSLLFGFLVSYVNSFYWELPENIFWQVKRGYHPAIIFVVLGLFPYIWLDKKLGWTKNQKNIVLILLGWGTTIYGVLTMESSIYTTSTGGIYFLFCRVVCLSILIKIFILDRRYEK